LDIADNLDFDFVAENLAEALGGTKELWEDLLVYFESRDPNFKRSWLTADYD
jgi:hypothetical protein